MPSIDHVHTYIRYKKRPGYYRCAAPNCTHLQEKEFLLGKNSLCSACGSCFVLTYEDLRKAKPRCLNCANTKEARRYREIQKLTEGLETGTFPSLIKEMEAYSQEQPANEDETTEFLKGLRLEDHREEI